MPRGLTFRRAGRAAGLAVVTWAAPTAAQSWADASAPYRLRIEKSSGAPWPADAGFVRVWPCGLNAAQGRARVFTAGGRAVRSQLLWIKPGDPWKILFDTSGGETTYVIYLDEQPPLAVSWRPEAGLIWETRALKSGTPDDWAQAVRLWDTAPGLLGRSPVAHVFNGIHLHGPTGNFAGRFTGYFQSKDPGEYAFAVVSTDPAFLRIDGRLVATRPLRANNPGRHGQFSGTVTLTPGRHQLDYLHFHREGPLAAEVAWKPPGQNGWAVMPPETFVPLADFHTVAFEPAPAQPRRLYFEWETRDSNLVDDLALVDVQFRLLPPLSGRPCRWRFDDGAEGANNLRTHLFPRPGYRQVRLEVSGRGQPPAVLTQLIDVEPRWAQRDEWRDPLWAEQRKELLARDFPAAPVDDLAALVRLAAYLDEPPLLDRLGAVCLRRQSEFRAGQAEAFFDLGRHYQSAAGHRIALAERAYRAAMALGGAESSAAERARLRLAGLLIDDADQPDQGLALLREVHTESLPADDRRRAQLYEGDARLAKGEVEAARDCYRTAGDVAPGGVGAAVRAAARLESVRHFLAAGAWDEADELLRQVEWESPLERMSLETGLARIRICLGRKEPAQALAWCHRLQPVAANDTQHADLLYARVEAAEALGQRAEARDAYAQLLKDHPYSEASARAKDRWGPQLSQGGK